MKPLGLDTYDVTEEQEQKIQAIKLEHKTRNQTAMKYFENFISTTKVGDKFTAKLCIVPSIYSVIAIPTTVIAKDFAITKRYPWVAEVTTTHHRQKYTAMINIKDLFVDKEELIVYASRRD